MNRYILILVIALQSFLMNAQSRPMTDATLASFKNSIRKTAESTQTISSEFIQEKEMSILNEKIVSKGIFYFKKERQLRWEYKEPYAYSIVIRNDQIFIRDEGKVTSFNTQSNKVFSEINRIILGSIRGTLLDDEKNFSSVCFETPNTYLVRLVPLSSSLKQSLKEIAIYFNRKDLSVDRLEMTEPTGDVTKINFLNKKINQPVADEKFVLQ